MNVEKQGNFQIESDGDVVTIYNVIGVRVARFGPHGYMYTDLMTLSAGGAPNPAVGITGVEEWSMFVRCAGSLLKVMIGEMHKPTRLGAS